MRASGRGLLAAGAAAGILMSTLAGCLDVGLISEVAFPPTVPGLPPDQPWVALPVGAWVTEGGIRADGVAGCFAAGCAPQAAVGLFRAEGDDAQAVARVLADPERLARYVAGTSGPVRGARRPAARTAVSVERLRSGEASGFVIRIVRPDGGHMATGIVLARIRGRSTTFVLVIAAAEDAARGIAASVAARI